MDPRFIGQSVRRQEDDSLLRGTGKFVDDLDPHGLTHAAFLRSPVAHGRIRSIDTSFAAQVPGVIAVLTLADLRPVLTSDRLPVQFKSDGLPPNIGPYILAKEEVVYVGETVALVIAESRAIAEDAVALIDLDIEELDPVTGCQQAVQPGAPKAALDRSNNIYAQFDMGYGDVDQTFADAAHRVSLALVQHRGGAHPIEGRGVLAHPDPMSGQMTVWSSTQQAHEARGFLIELLGLDETLLRVRTPEVGGGFGAKYLLYPEEVSVTAASLLLGRPIKWIEDRREHFLAAIQERDQFWDVEAACDASGKLVGIRGTMIHDGGAYVPQGVNLAYNAATAVPGPYDLPNYKLSVQAVATNKVPTIPVRGAGYPEGTFVMERVLDALADAAGLDRIEIRRRNLIPVSAMPFSTPLKSRSGSGITYDSGDFHAMYEQALKEIDLDGFADRKAQAAQAGRLRGIGVACGIKGTGRGPYESATVRIGKSGKVTVFTGAMPMGQGLKTALSQITAESLGVDPGDITVVCGDTNTISLGLGGFASRQTVVAGSSVSVAAKAVRDQALHIAAGLFEADVGDIELVDGMARVKGTEIQTSLKELAKIAGGSPGYSLPTGVTPGLEATEYFMPTGLTYGMGVHAVELEVDPETGAVTLQRYVVVNDCGRAINPKIVVGQIHGGVVHAIGNALFEFMGYDEQAQPTTTTLADYLMPTAPEIPRIDVHLAEYPSPLNPLGVKGVGEAGCLPTAGAIVSAIENALGAKNNMIQRIPVMPQDLFQFIQQGKQSSAA